MAEGDVRGAVERLTPEEIAEIRARCEVATSGPWTWMNYPDGRKLLLSRNQGVIHCPDAPMTCDPPDAAFIAHARTDIPKLLDALSALTADLEAAQRDRDELWCRALVGAIQAAEITTDDVERVTKRFNEMRTPL